MNSPMMLKHCSRFIDVYLGKVTFNPFMFLFGFTFSFFHISYLKYIVRYDINRYIRNLPTLKFFNTFKYKELDFDKEKYYLINSLRTVNQYEKDYFVWTVPPLNAQLESKDAFTTPLLLQFEHVSTTTPLETHS